MNATNVFAVAPAPVTALPVEPSWDQEEIKFIVPPGLDANFYLASKGGSPLKDWMQLQIDTQVLGAFLIGGDQPLLPFFTLYKRQYAVEYTLSAFAGENKYTQTSSRVTSKLVGPRQWQINIENTKHAILQIELLFESSRDLKGS